MFLFATTYSVVLNSTGGRVMDFGFLGAKIETLRWFFKENDNGNKKGECLFAALILISHFRHSTHTLYYVFQKNSKTFLDYVPPPTFITTPTLLSTTD